MPTVKAQTLPPGTPIFRYSELPERSRSAARDTVLVLEMLAYQSEVEVAKSQWTQSHDKAINDHYRIPRLVRFSHFIARLCPDQVLIEKFIEGNLCQFLEDGTYIKYL